MDRRTIMFGNETPPLAPVRIEVTHWACFTIDQSKDEHRECNIQLDSFNPWEAMRKAPEDARTMTFHELHELVSSTDEGETRQRLHYVGPIGRMYIVH
jgi:hypothetical protein